MCISSKLFPLFLPLFKCDVDTSIVCHISHLAIFLNPSYVCLLSLPSYFLSFSFPSLNVMLIHLLYVISICNCCVMMPVWTVMLFFFCYIPTFFKVFAVFTLSKGSFTYQLTPQIGGMDNFVTIVSARGVWQKCQPTKY